MKLYTTIEADGIPKLAKKGGNEWLSIKLHDNKGVVARVDFKIDEWGNANLEIWDIKGCQFIELEPLHTPRTKGKQKKGEFISCNYCGNKYNLQNGKDCPNCSQ